VDAGLKTLPVRCVAYVAVIRPHPVPTRLPTLWIQLDKKSYVIKKQASLCVACFFVPWLLQIGLGRKIQKAGSNNSRLFNGFTNRAD